MNYPIYCINLKERTDRKKHAYKEFKKINIEPSDVNFLDFNKHKKCGIYCCYDSHMKVWNDFYEKYLDKEICIAFEDDFKVTENSIYYLKKAISFIEKNGNEIDILFLHNKFIEYNDNHYKKNINNAYFTRGYGFLTHVYIVTRKYIKSILDKNDNHLPKPNGIHFDIDINMNANGILYSENIYYCKRPSFVQKDVYSDNFNNIFDEIIKKKYDNQIMFTIAYNICKTSKLLLKNDEKNKKMMMLIHKLYVKN
jgi:GR25 family glycosyltransferase involved in LPS biosynthesis